MAKYECKACGMTFKTEAELKAHNKKVHKMQCQNGPQSEGARNAWWVGSNRVLEIPDALVN